MTGLDIRPGAIRCISLKAKRDRISVTRLIRVEYVPPQADTNGSYLQSTLMELVSRHRLKGEQILACFYDKEMFVTRTSLPPMPSAELRQNLPFQIERFLSYPVQKARVDFLPLWVDPGTKLTTGLVAAAPKEKLTLFYQILERVSLRPQKIDIIPPALVRAFGLNYPEYLSQNVVLIEVGSEQTYVLLVRKGQIYECKIYPFGSLLGPESKFAMEDFLKHLSFVAGLFEIMFPAETLTCALLSGFFIPGLRENVYARLRIQTLWAESLRNLGLSIVSPSAADLFPSEFSVCVGLALEGVS